MSSLSVFRSSSDHLTSTLVASNPFILQLNPEFLKAYPINSSRIKISDPSVRSTFLTCISKQAPLFLKALTSIIYFLKYSIILQFSPLLNISFISIPQRKMSAIRVGLIGLSGAPPDKCEETSWTPSAHLPYLTSSPDYEIVALLNSSVESAKAAIERYTLPISTKAYSKPEGRFSSPALEAQNRFKKRIILIFTRTCQRPWCRLVSLQCKGRQTLSCRAPFPPRR